LHLGSESCQVKALQQFIDDLPPTQRLILLGDVLENTEYRLTKQHWRVLSRFRKLADQLELIWVRGNHDCDAESVAHLVGAEFVPEYTFASGDREILCVHGDVWDRFISDHPVATAMADWVYLQIQRMSRRLALRAKRGSKQFLRCVARVREEGLKYAVAKRADVIVCGHTHFPEAPPEPIVGPCAYYNTGCWTDHHCHYVTVQDGRLQLEEVLAEAEVPIATPAEIRA
ncbi:MAG TPA: metallophosphoesterase, partial [Gemmataceae bacterium]|nr:metallophosphoesterase [Gemmataceae bacterium]